MDNYDFVNNTDPKVLDQLYEDFKKDPDSVGDGWRNFFIGFDFAQKEYSLKPNNKKQLTKPHFKEKMQLGDPLNVKNAAFFGIFYIGILLLISYASTTYGGKGIYISSAISALTDIDAIAISVSKLGGSTINFLTAQNAILLATLSNTIVKIGITIWTGSKALKKYVLIGYGFIFIAGIVGFIILN